MKRHFTLTQVQDALAKGFISPLNSDSNPGLEKFSDEISWKSKFGTSGAKRLERVGGSSYDISRYNFTEIRKILDTLKIIEIDNCDGSNPKKISQSEFIDMINGVAEGKLMKITSHKDSEGVAIDLTAHSSKFVITASNKKTETRYLELMPSGKIKLREKTKRGCELVDDSEFFTQFVLRDKEVKSHSIVNYNRKFKSVFIELDPDGFELCDKIYPKVNEIIKKIRKHHFCDMQLNNFKPRDVKHVINCAIDDITDIEYKTSRAKTC